MLNEENKILLINPPVENNIVACLPPHGVGVIYAYLKSKGYHVDIFDFCVKNRFNKYPFLQNSISGSSYLVQIIKYLEGEKDDTLALEIEKIITMICFEKYTHIGFSIMCDDSLAKVLCIAKALKNKSGRLKIIVGGPFLETVSNDYEYLNDIDYIDFIICGDAEKQIEQIIQGKVIQKRIVEYIPLDEKMSPAFIQEDLSIYKKIYGKIIIPYIIGRGCVNHCAYCAYHLEQKYEYKTIDKIISEIKELAISYSTKYFFFCDSNINNNANRLERICNAIVDAKIDIKWGSFANLNNLNIKLLTAMKKSGCSFLLIGLESGSDHILENMKKGFTSSEAQQTIKHINNIGIKILASVISGFPSETEADHLSTVQFIKRNSRYLDTIWISPFYLKKNTEIYINKDKYSIIIENQNLSPINSIFKHSVDYYQGNNSAMYLSNKKQNIINLQKIVTIESIIKKPIYRLRTRFLRNPIRYLKWRQYFTYDDVL